MATYRITTPDGATYNVTAPDSASSADVMAFAQAQHEHAAATVANDSISQGAKDPTQGMSTFDKVAAGAGKAVHDLGQGVGQLVGLTNRNDVQESRTRDAPLMATTPGKVGNALGNVAALAPAALIPGAGTLVGGGLVGAATGLLQPSTSSGETLKNIALAGAGGAAVPALGAAFRVGKAAAEPFYDAGKNAIVGRALNRAAGSDAPAVANRLEQAAQPFVGPSNTTIPRTTMGELVPGSIPTVGQASGNAGVATLERAATATNPEVTNAISDVMKAQNAARVGTLEDMAGKDGSREFFGAARDATANQLYGEARKLGIDPKVLTPQVMENISTFAQRVPPEILSKAKKLAQINGDPLTDATSIKGLHWVKQAIDDEIGAATRSGNDTLKAAYTGLQKDLLTGMDNLSPAYANARKTYQAMSKPLNQMDVAGDILDKSVNKLTGNLQPNAFAKAVQSDATAARATGLPGATMEGTMAPAQMNALEMLLQDVKRSTAAQNAGRGSGSDTVQKLAYNGLMDQSGLAGTRTGLRVFSGVPVVGRVGSAAGEAYDRASVNLTNRLAQVMLDPGKAAQLMKQATPKQKNQILQLLQRTGSGLAISAPASANAAQQ